MKDPRKLLDSVEPIAEALLALVSVQHRSVAEHESVRVGLDSGKLNDEGRLDSVKRFVHFTSNLILLLNSANTIKWVCLVA